MDLFILIACRLWNVISGTEILGQVWRVIDWIKCLI